MPSPSLPDLLHGLSRLSLSGKRDTLAIEGFHNAGVLVPIILTGGEAALLFTRRTDHVETHKGQISFPGGMRDGDDPDIVHTALRETAEELGIGAGLIEISGLLDDIAVPSGFIITPVVGLLKGLPPLSPNPGEVAEAFTVPLDFFRDPANGRSEIREFRGSSRVVWFYQHGEHNIWGATAMIVRSFLQKTGLAET
jgi:8-oxo-dGTP pyrophosphatase MutT (NUDIX family)